MSEVQREDQPTPEVDPNEQIMIQDLANMVQIIDVVTSRGGLRGNEIEAVGALRNKIDRFVQANMPAQEEEPAPETLTEEEPSTH